MENKKFVNAIIHMHECSLKYRGLSVYMAKENPLIILGQHENIHLCLSKNSKLSAFL